MRIASLAVLTAGAIAIAYPALAEDVVVSGRVGGIGVGVDVGPHHRHHHRDRVVVREGRHHCKTVIVHKGNVTKKIRRCD
jgi:hypothetical protein